MSCISLHSGFGPSERQKKISGSKGRVNFLFQVAHKCGLCDLQRRLVIYGLWLKTGASWIEKKRYAVIERKRISLGRKINSFKDDKKTKVLKTWLDLTATLKVSITAAPSYSGSGRTTSQDVGDLSYILVSRSWTAAPQHSKIPRKF